MTPVPTHPGGPFYEWYKSVYGYAPPPTVDNQACRYIAWQKGWSHAIASQIPYGTIGNCDIWLAAATGSALAALAPPPPPPPPPLAAAGGALVPTPAAPAPTAPLSAPAPSPAPVAVAADTHSLGTFEATAYGPPWNAVQGTGVTKTGIDLRNAPHKYIIAVDPSVIPLHTYVSITPNPFGDPTAVFRAEDTGGAIVGKHIDIYDWRGRASQLAWGKRNVDVTQLSGPGLAAPPADTGPVYVNPLAHAHVTAERIDQGVDYAGTGYLVALADAVVTESKANGSGWEDEGYVEYKITQPGELEGAYVYYAEGVDPVVDIGDKLNAGDKVANLRAYMPHGIEVGFAAGYGEDSYYRYHDGEYHEGDATRPGIAFSNLIVRLGGPAGKIEGPVVGRFPEYMQSGEPSPAINPRGSETQPLALGTPEINPTGDAAQFDFPSKYLSAFVQLQRGAGNASHHSNSAKDYAQGITYVTKAD